jgi:hypothetical protein
MPVVSVFRWVFWACTYTPCPLHHPGFLGPEHTPPVAFPGLIVIVSCASCPLPTADFRAQTVILSPDSSDIRVICTVDPKMYLPQTLLNFCVKKVGSDVM